MLGLTWVLPEAYWYTAKGCVVTTIDATLIENELVVTVNMMF
jgi:hypothetical protein